MLYMILCLTIYGGALLFLYGGYTVPSIKTEMTTFQTWIIRKLTVKMKNQVDLGQGTISEAPCRREARVPATLPKQW